MKTCTLSGHISVVATGLIREKSGILCPHLGILASAIHRRSMLLARTGRWGYGAVTRPVPGFPLLRRTSIISCRLVSQRTGSPRRRTPKNQRHRDKKMARGLPFCGGKTLQRQQKPVSNTHRNYRSLLRCTSGQEYGSLSIPDQATSQDTLGKQSQGPARSTLRVSFVSTAVSEKQQISCCCSC